MTDDAERDAREVLYSLLSVERRINNSDDNNDASNNAQWHTPTVGEISNNNLSISEDNTSQSFNGDKQNELVDVELIEYPDPLEITDDVSVVSPKKKKHKLNDGEHTESKLETSAAQVKDRFLLGCECKESCFTDLIPESVFKHRLNVAELTKEEHDMYLMGVTMACLANRTKNQRNKERIRQRASYVFQGKRVCLDAFLYLENVTQYQLKRIRNHVMTHGVIPRVHGNIGKKPHNTFSLDMYKCAELFVKELLVFHTNDLSKPVTITGETRASIYNKFKENGIHPNDKIMGYTTFRHFMNKQFPNVRFSHSHSIDSPTTNSKSFRKPLSKTNNKSVTTPLTSQASKPITVTNKAPSTATAQEYDFETMPIICMLSDK